MKQKLTTDDMFDLRDALIHAERAHANDPTPNVRQKYSALFHKIGDILDPSREMRSPREKRAAITIEAQ